MSVGDMSFEEFDEATKIKPSQKMQGFQWEEMGGDGGGEMNETWKEQREGDEVSGRYVGKKTNVGKNKSNLYTLEQDDGSKIDVWGCTVIDNRMDEIAIGKMVKIVYQGKKPSKNFSQPYKDFRVFQGVDYVGDGK